MMKPKGYLCLILHAHLPFIRHPEYENFLEERWLYEAITETYIPLLQVLERLEQDGIPYPFTISLSPTLISMLTDNLLQERYLRHLNKLIELSEKEITRTKNEPNFQHLALMYNQHFNDALYLFEEKYNRNLVQAFAKFQEIGQLEIITCCATHGFLPLLNINPEAVKVQIALGVETYRKHFHRQPAGMWLPECAYYPGLDEFLAQSGIRYFFTENHGILYASPRPKYGTYAPILTSSGVAAFGRDLESSKQVWSSQEGYPGDFDYRDYYRDIGHDLDFSYIKPYIHDEAIRINTGIKYYRITGKNDVHKQPYVPPWAREKAAIHAGNFIFNRQKQVEHLNHIIDRPPIVVCPYDAELFGHWWYEGPQWLELVLRKIHYDQKTIRPITPSRYLEKFPYNQVSTPNGSSWGYKGYYEIWLNETNDWIYPHLHQAAQRMVFLANRYPQAQGLLREALNQAARELLLAQSSDWAFIMKTGTMVDYACKRTKEHIGMFNKLYEDIINQQIDCYWLNRVKDKNNIFPFLDYKVYASAQ